MTIACHGIWLPAAHRCVAAWLSWHFGVLGAITSGAVAPEAVNIMVATPVPSWITCQQTYGGHVAHTLSVLAIRYIPGRGCYAIAEVQTI